MSTSEGTAWKPPEKTAFELGKNSSKLGDGTRACKRMLRVIYIVNGGKKQGRQVSKNKIYVMENIQKKLLVDQDTEGCAVEIPCLEGEANTDFSNLQVLLGKTVSTPGILEESGLEKTGDSNGDDLVSGKVSQPLKSVLHAKVGDEVTGLIFGMVMKTDALKKGEQEDLSQPIEVIMSSDQHMGNYTDKGDEVVMQDDDCMVIKPILHVVVGDGVTGMEGADISTRNVKLILNFE